MLVCSARGRLPEGFSPAPWAAHPDARVRQEAVRLQLTSQTNREPALRAALQDDDPRLVRIGLTALQQQCPSAMTNLVIAVAENPKAPDEVRILAVGVLGRSHDRHALDVLLHIVDGGKTLLGRPRLAAKTPMVLAALRGLADVGSGDPRAASMLALARESSDAEVRHAARANTP